jgi:hypothetical protein
MLLPSYSCVSDKRPRPAQECAGNRINADPCARAALLTLGGHTQHPLPPSGALMILAQLQAAAQLREHCTLALRELWVRSSMAASSASTCSSTPFPKSQRRPSARPPRPDAQRIRPSQECVELASRSTAASCAAASRAASASARVDSPTHSTSSSSCTAVLLLALDLAPVSWKLAGWPVSFQEYIWLLETQR